MRASAEDLLRDADTALYCAKAQGKARYEVFDTAMRSDGAADAMKFDGVRPETILALVQP